MLDPIQQMCKAHGEDATITSIVAGTSADYDPTSETDFAPVDGTPLPVRGFIANIDDDVAEGNSQAATAGFTIQASEPIVFLAEQSRLQWSGGDQVILRARVRRFRGKLNGYTLYLGG